MGFLPSTSLVLDRLARLFRGAEAGHERWLIDLFDPTTAPLDRPALAVDGPLDDLVAAALVEGFGPGALEVVDPSLLSAIAADPAGRERLIRLLPLLGRADAPCTQEGLEAWARLAVVPGGLEVVHLALEVASPGTHAEWESLRAACEACPRDPLCQLLTACGKLAGPVAAETLLVLTCRVRTNAGARQFAEALAACQGLQVPPTGLVHALAKHVVNDESAAAVAEIGRLLQQRGQGAMDGPRFEELVRSLNTRVAVKRYKAALALLDEHDVSLGLADNLLLELSSDTTHMRWLACVLTELNELGKPIDRTRIVQLREWAEDEAAVVRYARGVRSLMAAGLPIDTIDELLLPRIGDEEATAVACLVGQLGRRRFEDAFTPRRARELMSVLTSRAGVKRYEQALALLADAGMDGATAEALAPDFASAKDDLLWLEAYVRHAASTPSMGKVDRLTVLGLRERCPEPAMLYRYFRLQQALAPFPADEDSRRTLVLDAANDELASAGLLEICRLLSRRGVDGCPLERVLRLHEAFPAPSDVRRYELATAPFKGHGQVLDDLAIHHATSDERAAAMAMVGRFLAARNLHDVGRNERVGNGLGVLLNRLGSADKAA